MTIETINLGNQVNDGLGDNLREAFRKVNANFSALSNDLSVTGLNIPETSSGEGIFAGKVGNLLNFKKLVNGDKIMLSSDNENIIISSYQPDAFTVIHTQSGNAVATGLNASVTIQGGNNVLTNSVDNVITVDTVLDLNQILKVVDFGPITGEYDNTVQMNTAMANLDFGTVLNVGRIDMDFGTL